MAKTEFIIAKKTKPPMEYSLRGLLNDFENGVRFLGVVLWT
jgi:hypothetical protein